MARYQIDNRPWQIDTSSIDPEMRIVQNCKNLLMTAKGQIPYDRLRGFNQELLSQPMTQLRQNLARELDRVMLWEPYAQVVSSNCMLDPNGEVYITATIEVELEEE